MVRVVHVINRRGRGGAERQLAQLVTRSRHEHEVHELAGRTGPELLRLGRLLRRRDIDCVVAWLDRPQILVAGAAPGRLTRIASVRGAPGRGSARSTALLRRALARYDRIVVNSDASRRAVLAFASVDPSGIAVVPNGVDLVEPSPAAANAVPRIGFIGRDDPAKGLDVLLDALALLGDGVEAALVGRGVGERLAPRADLRERHAAHPECDEPWAALGGVDVLVVPSRSEGSPNVVLEAFARGVPVVGTDAGGLPELLADDRGVIVPAGNPEALADALRLVFAGERRPSPEKGRAYAQSTHGWDVVVGLWDDLLEG